MQTLFEKMNAYSALVEGFMKKHTDALYEREEFSSVKDSIRPLFDSVAYSLFAGGKRLRPFLAMEFCAVCGKMPEDALSYAAAIEMIHTFSLIHDDLPCMDDDDLRRGKPTNHKVFGEATALLAGDALAFYAFHAACDNTLSAETNLRAVKQLTDGAGVCGMIAGQQIDMWAEEHEADLELLTLLQQKKTGALFETACLLGCIAAGCSEKDVYWKSAVEYADHIGLAFQITDDILDVCGDSAVLGKNIGSDAINGKATFVTLLGLDGAKAKAANEVALAIKALEPFKNGDNTVTLEALATYILERKS